MCASVCAMHIYIYIYMYIYIDKYTYVYIHMYMYMYMHVCVYAYVRMCICICVCMCSFLCTLVAVYVFRCLYARTYIYIYMWIYTRIYIYTHTLILGTCSCFSMLFGHLILCDNSSSEAQPYGSTSNRCNIALIETFYLGTWAVTADLGRNWGLRSSVASGSTGICLRGDVCCVVWCH